MHPMSAGGARVDIEHIDARISRSTFPTLIPTWPPFTLIRAIRHESLISNLLVAEGTHSEEGSTRHRRGCPANASDCPAARPS